LFSVNRDHVNISIHMSKIIVRIKGGLGNQLFSYAAARRLATVNDVELVIDNVTGFIRDSQYQRHYSLDRFFIPIRKATRSERLEPFDRYRRGMMKWFSSKQPFSDKIYLEQDGMNFDDQLLNLKVKRTLYLDGLWQSENYFKDIGNTIREDLQIIPPQDPENQQMVKKINHCNAVALHVRWFDSPNSKELHNLTTDYYHNAISIIEGKVDSPYYFLFSDDSEAASKKIYLPENRVTFVNHNRGDENAYADLWLMSQCQHFIIANSTFSWWGAWLSNYPHKIVIAPDLKLSGVTSWGFDKLIPPEWILI
jgi:Glycosyl transferase family 11